MIAPGAQIDPAAEVSAEAVVEAGAWIGPGTAVMAGAVIQANAVVGRGFKAGETEPTFVATGAIVGSGAVLYHSVRLEPGAKVWHNAVLRDHVVIGRGAAIGSLTIIEHHTQIGDYSSIHGHCQVGDYSLIGDYVFVGPGFLSVSDLRLDYRRPHLHGKYAGVTIKDKARVGGRVLAYPGTVIGVETVVGAASVVKGNLLDGVLYLGDPARAVRKVDPDEFLRLHD